MSTGTVVSCMWIAIILLMSPRPGRAASDDGSILGCGQPDCLTCHNSTGCVQCRRYIVLGTRQCVPLCPGSMRPVHSDAPGYHGILCRAPRFLDSADMTREELTILVAALIAAAVCIGVVIGAFLFLRLRRKIDPLNERAQMNHAIEMQPADDFERIQFLTRLQALRPETHNFLEMLNDTRKGFNMTTSSGNKPDVDAKIYRTVIRDLSRILSLLNRREEHIRTIPVDWRRLLEWSEKLLKRYKRQKLSRDFGSAPHIEYLPSSSSGRHQASRRSRSTSGRIHTPSGTLPAPISHFNVRQAIIEEDELEAAHSLPPGGVPANYSFAAPAPGCRPVRSRRGEQPSRRRAARRQQFRHARHAPYNASMPAGLDQIQRSETPVFLHRVNGGHGADVFCSESVAGTPLRSANSALSLRSDVWPMGSRSLPPGAGLERPATNQESRPTYRDWPADKLRHQRVTSERDRERTSDLTDTTDDHSGNSVHSHVGGPARPPPPVYRNDRDRMKSSHQLDSSYNEQSDYIDRDIDSFSGRYYSDEHRTVM